MNRPVRHFPARDSASEKTRPSKAVGQRAGPELVTLGETCVVLEPVSPGLLRYSTLFERHIGGAESNVAVALTRLGHSAGWMSRVGDDELGQTILSILRGEGIDVSRAILDPRHRTGLFLRQRSAAGGGQNLYYRRGSAASRLSVRDVDESYIAGARILHVTGITPALSPSCRRAVLHAMDVARRRGVTVSFDPNIRLTLWSAALARRVMTDMLRRTDIFLPGADECELLFGSRDLDEVYERVKKLGVETLVLKLGANGAAARDRKGTAVSNGFKVPVVDVFGAGDAFAAGFLAGRLDGWSLRRALEFANAVGALSVAVRGNVEAFPLRNEVDRFLAGADAARR